MKKLLFILCGFAFLAFPVFAAKVTFDIQPKVLRLGEIATASFTMTGANNPKRPHFPPVEGWQIQYAGTQHSFASSPSGMISTVTYQYRMLPMKVGKHTIGPLTYVLDGTPGKTGQIALEVIERKDEQSEQGKELSNFIMARLETDATSIYNHQVFDLTLSVYYRSVQLSSDMRLVEFQDTGFTLTSFKPLPSGREIINDELYTVQRFKASARAITTGTFTLAPIIRVNIYTQDKRSRSRFDPFFERLSMRATRAYDVTAQALELEVKPLPEADRPPAFSGAVGNFSFDVAVKPTKVNTGDPITITMQLSGMGNMDTVLAPKLALSDAFKDYDAKMLESSLNESETAGKRIFEQVVIPTTDAVTELPPLTFSYFHPQREKYVTIQRGPFPLQVTANAEEGHVVSAANPAATATRKKLLDQDIIYLKSLPRHWRISDSVAWYTRPGTLALQGLPLLALVCAVIIGRHHKTLASDVAKARRHEAPKAARAAVRKAQQAIRDRNDADYFAALWEGVSAYFSNRLNIGAGEVSRDLVEQTMTEKGMPPEALSDLTGLFDTIDMHRYTPGAEIDAKSKKALLERMTSLLKTCERLT